MTRDQIREAAKIAMGCKRIISCWAMGLTQHKNAVATIQEVMNFHLLGGHIGRPGAGPCPVRGHSNVQGDRTMGIWERMNETFMEKLGREFQFTPPKEHGTDTVETIKQMHDGKIRFFLGMGGNFLAATPDTEYTAKAMQKCRVTAHVSTKLNRSHLITGEIALILPCLGRSEIDRAGNRRAVRDGGRFDGDHQSFARSCAAGERTSAKRAGHYWPPGGSDVREIAARLIGKVWSRTTTAFGITSSMSFPASKTSTTGFERTSSICLTTRATNGSSTPLTAKRNS